MVCLIGCGAWIYASCSESPQSRTDGCGRGSEFCVGPGVSNPALNAGSTLLGSSD